MNTTGSDVTMETKKVAAYYRKRVPKLLSDVVKSNINFSSSESLGLGKTDNIIKYSFSNNYSTIIFIILVNIINL